MEDPFRHVFTRDEHGNLRLYDFEWSTPHDGPTLSYLADLAVVKGELGTFDFALPITWCDDVRAKTGDSPFGFVWSYPPSSIWGEPFPLTTEAKALLDKYEAAIRG